MQQFTEQEAKEAGLPLVLMNQWGELMQAIWTWCISMRLPDLKQDENEIFFKDGSIRAIICNYKFIQVELRPLDEDKPSYIEIYYLGNPKPVIEILSIALLEIVEHNNL